MATRPMDYRSFGENGPPKDPGDGVDSRWWLLDGDKAAQSISGVLTTLKEAQAPRLTRFMANTRLYDNAPALGVIGFGTVWGAAGATTSTAGQKTKITYNLVQSATDTVTSKAGKNKPRPFFLPSGGNFRQHRKAKRLNKFVDGMFYENKVYTLGIAAFRDAAVWGDGTIKIVEKNGRVAFERVLPMELFVDEVEALLGSPRQMHHVRFVDRRKLAAAFPDFADTILNKVEASKLTELGARGNVSDMVLVRESWHLRSGPDATDGKHIVSVDDYAICKMEEWEHDFFPFARMRWSPRLVGYWSQSLSEQLQPTQFELNGLMQQVQRATYKAGYSTTWVPKGSNVPKDFITNATDTVIEYTGTVSPHREVYPVVPPEIYRQIEQHKRDGFELAGVTLLSAIGQKPAGLDSKVALREQQDIESDRFRTVGDEYQNLFLELARIGLAFARMIAKKNGGKYEVTSRGRGSMEKLSWSDIGLAEDEYGLECFPVSSLPRDPAGRLQTITEYAQAGYLTPREARRLLDFPDLESVESLANAAEDWLVQCLDKIVDDGEYAGPDPEDDLKLGRELVLQYIAVGKSKGLEDDRIEMLRRFLKQIDAFEKKAVQLSLVQGGAGGGLAPPTAPPIPMAGSQLVPNGARPAPPMLAAA